MATCWFNTTSGLVNATAYGAFPCGGYHTCCHGGDTCMTNNFCYNPSYNKIYGAYYVASCTDKVMQDGACSQNCNSHGLFSNAIYNVPSRSWGCCGVSGTSGSNWDCSDATGTTDTFQASPPEGLQSIGVANAPTGVSVGDFVALPSIYSTNGNVGGGSSGSGSTSSSNGSDNSSTSVAPLRNGLGTSGSIAFGVGLGIGLTLLILGVVIWCIRLRRKRKDQQLRDPYGQFTHANANRYRGGFGKQWNALTKNPRSQKRFEKPELDGQAYPVDMHQHMDEAPPERRYQNQELPDASKR